MSSYVHVLVHSLTPEASSSWVSEPDLDPGLLHTTAATRAIVEIAEGARPAVGAGPAIPSMLRVLRLVM